MDYDIIVLGTGLTECILSGMLSSEGHRVLVLDTNPYYGGDCASLPEAPRGYLLDLVSKLVMASGTLVKILTATGAVHYNTDWMVIEGSYVMQGKKLHKVPVTPEEALSSPLMGFFEKRRMAKFLQYCIIGMEKNNMTTMRSVFNKYGLEPATISLIGHALALHDNDTYLDRPAEETVTKVALYASSLQQFPNAGSPYIYPLYGMSVLPQVFSRYCSVRGGVFMVGVPGPVTLPSNTTVSLGDGRTYTAKVVVAAPPYLPELVSKIGQIVRCICILSHPIKLIPNCKSAQVILPASELPGRRSHDIYVMLLSDDHRVCPPGKFVGLVSTTVETLNPGVELEPGLALFAPIDEKFMIFSDVVVPRHDVCVPPNVFLTQSYDASTHFEGTAANVLKLFQQITGKPFDLERPAPDVGEML